MAAHLVKDKVAGVTESVFLIVSLNLFRITYDVPDSVFHVVLEY